MENHDDRLRAFLSRGSLLIALFASLPHASHAAGFDCKKATIPAETAICQDSNLSKLDSDLAAAWKDASARSKNAATLKAAQLRWLAQRNACDGDVPCLSDRYRERLAELSGKPLAADRWDQTWQRDTDNPSVGGQLTFAGAPTKLHFTLFGYNGGNTGAYEGDVALSGDEARYRGKDGCRLDFSRKAAHVRVREISGCGEGSGVSFEGEYITHAKFAAKPQSDLLTLKALDDAKQNQAARALLGKDYDTVVETVNLSDPGEDADQLGAKVQRFFVRGLANTNASIVMHRGTQLWIGVLVFDSGNKVRMRYYTNVPEWKKRLPKTLRAWHDTIDKDLPIDMMS